MEQKKAITEDRRIRIERIKKTIRILIFLGVLIPLLANIVLSFRVHMLNRKIEALTEKITLSEAENQPKIQGLQLFLEECRVSYLNLQSERISETAELSTSIQVEQPDSIVHEDVNVYTLNGTSFRVYAEEVLPSNTKKVYLTFDDGPSSNTDDILNVLAEYGVKATFFVVGKEGDYSKEMYKRIVEEGHTIGLHSYSHEYAKIYESKEAFQEDFMKESDMIYQLTGIRPFCYRFPGGSSTGKMNGQFELFKECLDVNGLLYFDWNISSGDATEEELSTEQIIANVTTNLNNYDHAIILFHDAYGKQSTVLALREIIEYIQDMDNTVLLPISPATEQIHQKD